MFVVAWHCLVHGCVHAPQLGKWLLPVICQLHQICRKISPVRLANMKIFVKLERSSINVVWFFQAFATWGPVLVAVMGAVLAQASDCKAPSFSPIKQEHSVRVTIQLIETFWLLHCFTLLLQLWDTQDSRKGWTASHCFVGVASLARVLPCTFNLAR